MKRILALTFWAVGSSGAVLFVCFWMFGMIYTRKFRLSVLAFIAFGVYCAWEGIKTFLEEKRTSN
jgi:hypothetical protein